MSSLRSNVRFRIGLPANWLILETGGAAGSIESVLNAQLDKQLAHRPDLASQRPVIEQLLNLSASALRDSNPQLMAVAFEVADGVAVGATCIAVVRERLLGEGEGEGQLSADAMKARLDAEYPAGDPAMRTHTVVDLPAGRAVVIDQVESVEFGEHPHLASYSLQVLIPFPPEGDPVAQHLVILTFSTPTISFARQLRRLFAQISRTFGIVDTDAPAATG